MHFAKMQKVRQSFPSKEVMLGNPLTLTLLCSLLPDDGQT